jgi:dethiobiotin synthetase
MLDLMNALALPVLLVARAGLGTINHTLLSLHALRDAQLTVAGVVLNEVTPASESDRFILRDNAATIQRLGAVEVLGTLPHRPLVSGASVALADHMPGLPKLRRILALD